ncbi:MAG: hypothetical protein UZ01_02832 [Candidatus Brocadia sinica]|nr:MAG: hypothetical protein UZ01_02832 [Candidatus Brocadia sinica]
MRCFALFIRCYLELLIILFIVNLFKRVKNMVKAPEKFLDEYLSHEKGFGNKTVAKPSRAQIRKISDEEITRLKHNVQTLWGIYGTPEIKEILSRKHKIYFLDIETAGVSLKLSYVDKGISMEYEVDMGSKKDLAGAHIYKQGETIINKYFTAITGVEELLKTNNVALQAVVNVFLEKEIPETDIWDMIAKGGQIHLSAVPYP